MLTGIYMKWAVDLYETNFSFGPFQTTTVLRLLESPLVMLMPFFVRNAYKKWHNPEHFIMLESELMETNLNSIASLEKHYAVSIICNKLAITNVIK